MSISLETHALANANTAQSPAAGHLEVWELPDRVRYILPIDPRRRRVRHLWQQLALLGCAVGMLALVVFGVPYAISHAETWLGVALQLFLGSQLFGGSFVMGFSAAERLWISLMEWSGERTEIEITRTTLHARQRRSWIRKTHVFPIWQISGLEVGTLTRPSSEESGVWCRIKGRSFRLVEKGQSRPHMIQLAQDLGRRLKLSVTVSDPVSIYDLLYDDLE